jgi:hypothetical protein
MPAGWVIADVMTGKIKFRLRKSTVIGTLLLENVRIRIHIKYLDLYQSEKSDPDQSEKQDPDLYQNYLDP